MSCCSRGQTLEVDIDDLDDDDEWIAYEGEGPSGQSQLEMMNMMLGTEDVHFIGLEPKHRSHRVHVETVDEEAACPICGRFGIQRGLTVGSRSQFGLPA